jgi:alpha-ketoglutarate-dependent taurine dioxygenase
MAFTTRQLTPRIASAIFADRTELLGGVHSVEIRALLQQRGVLVLRGIDFSDEEEVAFGATVGRVRDDFGHHVMPITFDRAYNPKYADYFRSNTLWHFDGSWDDMPPFASILTPRVLSATGGETEFANLYAAYEDLSDADKAMLDEVKVVHSMEASLRRAVPDPSAEQERAWHDYPERPYPLVWRHASGRRSLVLSSTSVRVEGMSRDKGDALLARLTAHATSPRYVYRHHWRMGDALIWDNTGTAHRVLPFDMASGRRLHRVTLLGEEYLRQAA